jgi:hypothetical protein
MNKLAYLRKYDSLQQADKRINDLNATVHYTYNNLPRQTPFTSHTEEDLYKQVFWFQAEHYPAVKITTLQYRGKTVEWDNRVSTYSHYWLGKGRMSFEEFKDACFSSTEKVTA